MLTGMGCLPASSLITKETREAMVYLVSRRAPRGLAEQPEEP